MFTEDFFASLILSSIVASFSVVFFSKMFTILTETDADLACCGDVLNV